MPKEFQKAPLQMIFDVKKENLRHKARYVVGGHKIDSSHLESYSSVVKTMSIQTLQTITQKCCLNIMVGDTRNTFLYAPTNKKVHTIAGKEFRERQGYIAEIIQSQYGMATASRL